MCQNLGLQYDQRNSPRENPAYRITPPDDSARALQRMIILLQNALPGSPVLYFGDEAGMWGGDDPDNRKPMPWPELTMEAENSFEVNGDDRSWPVVFDSAMYSYYRAIHGLRKELLPLRTGTMQTLLLDDVASLYAFVRASGSEKVYVAVNAGDRPQVCTLSYLGLPDGVRLEDPLLGVSFFVRRDAVSITLPGRTATLLVPRY
jgi:glycosidase